MNHITAEWCRTEANTAVFEYILNQLKLAAQNKVLFYEHSGIIGNDVVTEDIIHKLEKLGFKYGHKLVGYGNIIHVFKF